MKTLSIRLQEYRAYHRFSKTSGKIEIEITIDSPEDKETPFMVRHPATGIRGYGETLTTAVNDYFLNLKKSLMEKKDDSEKSFVKRSNEVKAISELCE